MAVFVCDKCGALFEARCKPKKCENCGSTQISRKT
ncbi:MAG: rubredoxin [Candidatus Odinarchaeota archaeon]